MKGPQITLGKQTVFLWIFLNFIFMREIWFIIVLKNFWGLTCNVYWYRTTRTSFDHFGCAWSHCKSCELVWLMFPWFINQSIDLIVQFLKDGNISLRCANYHLNLIWQQGDQQFWQYRKGWISNSNLVRDEFCERCLLIKN